MNPEVHFVVQYTSVFRVNLKWLTRMDFGSRKVCISSREISKGWNKRNVNGMELITIAFESQWQHLMNALRIRQFSRLYFKNIYGTCTWFFSLSLTVLPFIAVTPEVYTSEQKWSFLHNWAVGCDRKVIVSSDYHLDYFMHWAIIQCLNKPAGRYVSVVIPKVIVDMMPLLTSISLTQFFSEKGIIQ